MYFIYFAHCSQIVSLYFRGKTFCCNVYYTDINSSKVEGEDGILNCVSDTKVLARLAFGREWHKILLSKVNWKQTDSQRPCWSALGYGSDARTTWTHTLFYNSAESVQAWDVETRISSHHRLQNAVILRKLLNFHCPPQPLFGCLIPTFQVRDYFLLFSMQTPPHTA